MRLTTSYASTWSLIAMIVWIQPRRAMSSHCINTHGYDGGCLGNNPGCPAKICLRWLQGHATGRKRSAQFNYFEGYQTQNRADGLPKTKRYETSYRADGLPKRYETSYLRQPVTVKDGGDNYDKFLQQLLQEYPIEHSSFSTLHKQRLPFESYIDAEQSKYDPSRYHMGLLALIAGRRDRVQRRSSHNPIYEPRLRLTDKLDRSDDGNILDWLLYNT